MADKDYKAFIVEGEAREPQVIDNISRVFFKHGNFKIITLPAGENIYMLWKKLKADDFDTDIIEVLRESNKKIREQLKGLSRDDFSEVFLFFDYDVHQTNLGKSDDGDVINQMLESFDNETENGKLYISYPMVEALRDFEAGKCGNGDNCFVEISDLAKYKNISSRNSLNPHFRDYNIDVWKEIIDVFSMRVSCLLGNAEVISYEQYLDEAIWICSLWRCLKTLPMLWRSMQTRVFLIHRKSGWMILILSVFIRCFQRLLSFGDSM